MFAVALGVLVAVAVPTVSFGQDEQTDESTSPATSDTPTPLGPLAPPANTSGPAAGPTAPEEQATPAEVATSQQAYAEDNPAESRQLVEQQFPEELSGLDQEAGRLLDPSDYEKFFSDTAARVNLPGDRPQVLLSSSPLRDQDDSGAVKPVDLDIQGEDAHYEAENPVTDVSLPAEAGGQVRLQGADVGVQLQLPDAERAQAGVLDGDKLFYHEVATDADLLLAPVTQGAEIFAQLRSVNSPERLSFGVDLPAGAELKSADGEGAEIVRSGDVLARITNPAAVDADGTSVPSRLQQTGPASFDLVTDHRSVDARYPILVDPVVEDWYGNN